MGTIDNIVGLGTATVITAFSVGCAANKPPETSPQQKIIVMKSSEIPSSVLAKYKELEEKYRVSVGAWINECVKGREKIFEVIGSGGFGGSSYYYSKGGKYIGRDVSGDLINGDTPLPKPPVNSIEEYQCTSVEIIK